MKNTALITGSYGGLGTCFVDLHASSNGDLILVGRSQKKLEDQKRYVEEKYHVTVNIIGVDLSESSAAQFIYDTCKNNGWSVDYLINNAGFGGQGDFARERTMEQDLSMIAVNIETFSPPIFAAYCSKNGIVCLNRLSKYKQLIGPIVMLLNKKDGVMHIEYTTEDGRIELPQFLLETEFVFLSGIIRRATKELVIPVKAQMKTPIKTEPLESFLGISVEKGEKNIISYCMEDLKIPFISYNESMWNYFKPELTKRLSELDVDASMGARVRTALTELLPGGLCGIDEVATTLGISKRTLQRKLSDENTTFQKQLNNTREILAIHYLSNTDMSTNDIAYLLGYQELNSFLRAFTLWTGKSVSQYRKSLEEHL